MTWNMGIVIDDTTMRQHKLLIKFHRYENLKSNISFSFFFFFGKQNLIGKYLFSAAPIRMVDNFFAFCRSRGCCEKRIFICICSAIEWSDCGAECHRLAWAAAAMVVGHSQPNRAIAAIRLLLWVHHSRY